MGNLKMRRSICLGLALTFHFIAGNPSVFADSAPSPSPSPSQVAALATPPARHPITEVNAQTQTSYTDFLIRLIPKWPTASSSLFLFPDKNPVKIRCMTTPGNELYMGVKQLMTVAASLESVEAVVDAIDEYRHLFPGLANAHIESRDGNLWMTSWEQEVPIFFIPNVHYEMSYWVDKSNADRKVYRYQLVKKGSMKASDGLIILDRATENGHPVTHYVEYDFFDADWGIASSMGTDKLWRDSVEAIYLSDAAIKFKAENPSWSYDKIQDESKSALKQFPLKDIIKSRAPFQPDQAEPGAAPLSH